MIYDDFIHQYHDNFANYWNKIQSEIESWKKSYMWPKDVSLSESISKRNELEGSIQKDLQEKGHLSKKIFDDVMKWGFGRPSSNSEEEINNNSKKAFYYLQRNDIKNAALLITIMKGIGISRASKVLALANQNDFGIYDSRAADGLSDLLNNGRRLIPIPPGKVITGDTNVSTEQFCSAFQNYTWVLRFFREQAQKDSNLCGQFSRVADFEIALFSRSRNRKTCNNPNADAVNVENDEGDCYWTLSKGKKAKKFRAYIDEDGVVILTGIEGKSKFHLDQRSINECLNYFRSAGWFPLANCVDNLNPTGLGYYFRNTFKKSPKYASHFAATMFTQGRLEYKYGSHNSIELKVTKPS